jgi:hypothetical protein
MSNVRVNIHGIDAPDARSTPSGMPETGTEDDVSANAELLYLAVRETIRHADRDAKPQSRNDVPGVVWNGSPQKVAESLWDGLDGSGLAGDVMLVLYEELLRTGHMGRLDTGNRRRQWWVADEWKDGGYAPLEEPPAYDLPAAPEGLRDVRVLPVAQDPVAAIQAILDRNRQLEERVRQLEAAAVFSEDKDELVEEVNRLRADNTELREKNRRLRQQAAADDMALGRR